MQHTILIAEDDKDIVEILRLYLENEGFIIQSAKDGREAYLLFEKRKVDLAIIDIMMPIMNGYELIQKIRETSNIPLLIVSAKNMDQDKILGLNIGADDYLTKPFNPLEIVARVKSALRRFYELNSDIARAESSKIVVGELELDTLAFSVKKNGEPVSLTPTEYKILAILMKEPSKIFTKMQIYENITGSYYISDDNTLMVHISKIREKIEDDPKNPRYLKTVRGLGYKVEGANVH